MQFGPHVITPTDWVLRFKKIREWGRDIGVSASNICKWRNRGGSIPVIHQRSILLVAQKEHLDITPRDLILGRKIEGDGLEIVGARVQK